MKLAEMRLWFQASAGRRRSARCGRTLNAKLRGHYQYYGINDNWPLLMAVPRQRFAAWPNATSAAAVKRATVNWGDFNRLSRSVTRLASPTRLTDLIAMSRQWRQ